MDYRQAVDQLARWSELSCGAAIDIGKEEQAGFESVRRFSDTEIAAFEDALGWQLPDSYRQFLAEIGQSRLFISPKYGLGLEFYSPSKALECSRSLQELDEDQPITDLFCMIGHDSGLGDYFGFIVGRRGPRNFDVFCHEYPVYDYASVSDELKSWKSFDDWIITLVQSGGEEVI